MNKKNEAVGKKTFEKELCRLEEIVSLLEKGETPLDDSIKLFEEGVKKADALKKYLDEAKRKIEIITVESGVLATKPFEAAE
ncbi:MAG: exodeoxyribonuclease VII small subunit [bacterium]